MSSRAPRLRALATAVLLTSVPAMVSAQALTVASPDGKTQLSVEVQNGALRYAVRRNGANVVTPSRLGFAFKGAPPLVDSLRITNSQRASYDSTWTQPWGEVARVRDHHNELRVDVAETRASARRFSVVFRVFDDGVGFRYELPDQPAITDYEISDELTEFTLAGHASA